MFLTPQQGSHVLFLTKTKAYQGLYFPKLKVFWHILVDRIQQKETVVWLISDWFKIKRKWTLRKIENVNSAVGRWKFFEQTNKQQKFENKSWFEVIFY